MRKNIEYQAVLDESIHNNVDEFDTVEIILNEDDSEENSQLDHLKLNDIGGHNGPDLSVSKDGLLPALYSSWNILTFAWVKPLLLLGNKRPLEPDDLYHLCTDDTSKGVYLKFRSIWKAEISTSRKSLLFAYLNAFGGPFLAAGALKLFHDCTIFIGPYLLRKIIAFLKDPTMPTSTGLIYVTGLFLANLTMSLCLRQYFFFCYRVGLRLRSSVITSVFHKSLNLSSAAISKRSTGEITNLMAIDSTRLQELTPYLHAIWYSFFQIGVSLYFLWQLVGPSCIGGLTVIVVFIPISGKIASYCKDVQKELSTIRDERVKVTNEILSGIKVIKLQAWESEFQSRLTSIRQKELLWNWRYGVLQALSGTLAGAIPLLVAIVTFLVYVILGGNLDVGTALTALALFDIIRFPLSVFPQVINNLVEARVAVDRVRSFLLEPEKVPVSQYPLTTSGAMLAQATIVWDSGRRLSKDEQSSKSIFSRLRSSLKNSYILNVICGKILAPRFTRSSSTVNTLASTSTLSSSGGDSSDQRGGSGKYDKSVTDQQSQQQIESQCTNEEFEYLLCQSQLSDAMSWIATLERQLKSLQSISSSSTSTSHSLNKISEDENDNKDYVYNCNDVTYVKDPMVIDEFSEYENIERNEDGIPSTTNGFASTNATTSYTAGKSAGRLLAVVRVNMLVRPGSLVALVGQVGCGKSTVMSALLGDTRIVWGKASLRGSVAYVAQRPYIMNCSLKDNILFGLPFDENRYNWTLEVCALLSDLKVLPAGDATEIGERGINLSGGQKARVALARAVYSDADVYLLDDPLAAVDAHVGLHLFEQCIMALKEKGKCVLLSTNALRFLRSATHILVLKEGRVVQSGCYQELVDYAGGAFSDMMNTFDEGTSSAKLSKKSSSSKDKINDITAITSGNSPKELVTDSSKPLVAISVKDTSVSASASAGNLMSVEDRETGNVDMSVYLAYLKAAGGWMILLLLLVLFVVAEGVAVLSSWWLAYWSQYGALHTVWFYMGIYATLNLSLIVFQFLKEFFLRCCCWMAGKVMYENVLHSVLLFPMSYFDTTPLGRITNRLSKDIYTIDEQLPSTLRWYFGTLLKVASTVLYICIVTPMFLFGLFPVVYFYYAAQSFYIRTSRELSRLDSSSRSPIYALFSETLDGLSTIRAFRSEPLFITRIFASLDANQRAYFLTFSCNCWLAIRLEMVGTLIITLTALLAVMGRDNSPLTPDSESQRQAYAGVAGLALSLALAVTGALNWSVRMASDLQSQMVSVERVSNYVESPHEAEHEKDSDPSSQQIWPKEGLLQFQEVCLQYRPDTPTVLDKVTFTVLPREKVGVVGRTGAGKSSLVVALLRLVELSSGEIVIDGRKISELGLRTLRAAVAVIPQDPVLFSGTLRSNIDPFSKYTDAEVWEGLRRVQLGDAFSSLDYKIGEGASNLSVGQRQLICISRALLSKSKIIVMDEATAAVDVETDAVIQRAIRVEFRDSTCLTVAHRLNTIIDSDKVLVMDKGKVAEFGSPSELLERENSLFASLVANWDGSAED